MTAESNTNRCSGAGSHPVELKNRLRNIMTDVFDSAKRSEIMSRVKCRGNVATELRLIQLFRAHGITGWRRNFSLFGKPDFVFPKHRLAIFVDGDFWHGHPKRGQIPASNREFWVNKIKKNKARERLVNRTLKKKKWRVLRIWQSSLRSRPRRTLARIRSLFDESLV